jgi:multidrug efflux pump subunit AcrA (membrane-fusion protein)
MSTEVKVPAVGESITSGIVSVWHKKSGDQVKAGQVIARLEGAETRTLEAAQATASQQLTSAYQDVRDGVLHGEVRAPRSQLQNIIGIVNMIGKGKGQTGMGTSPPATPAPPTSPK